jgi:hypothetical protein
VAKKAVCPLCGYSDNKAEYREGQLRSGTVINDYMIGKSLARNAQGNTYLALHLKTRSKHIIKEYYPEFATRLNGRDELDTGGDKDKYSVGIEAYQDNERTLNRGVVCDIFRENNTIYIVETLEPRPATNNKALIKEGKPHPSGVMSKSEKFMVVIAVIFGIILFAAMMAAIAILVNSVLLVV